MGTQPGLGTWGGDGGHAVLLDAVRPQFPSRRHELQRFDWLRTMRNSTEYPDVDTAPITAQDVSDAIKAAQAIYQIAESFVHRECAAGSLASEI